jgi:hypothetical protein
MPGGGGGVNVRGPAAGPVAGKSVGRNGIVKKPGGGRGKGGVSCDWGSHEGGHVERKEGAAK